MYFSKVSYYHIEHAWHRSVLCLLRILHLRLVHGPDVDNDTAFVFIKFAKRGLGEWCSNEIKARSGPCHVFPSNSVDAISRRQVQQSRGTPDQVMWDGEIATKKLIPVVSKTCAPPT